MLVDEDGKRKVGLAKGLELILKEFRRANVLDCGHFRQFRAIRWQFQASSVQNGAPGLPVNSCKAVMRESPYPTRQIARHSAYLGTNVGTSISGTCSKSSPIE